VPPWQVLPVWQVLPAQQGCACPPHATQVLPWQMAPAWQLPSAQQGWPWVPQVATQVSLLQMLFAWQ
jgi:hypothetical protein